MTIQTSEETDYIELAKQAGFFVWADEQKTIEGYGEDLERFAKLVAQHERERIKEEQQRCYIARGEAT
jgi:hypothetical protein